MQQRYRDSDRVKSNRANQRYHNSATGGTKGAILAIYRFISPVFIWIMTDWMLGAYLSDRFDVKEWMTYTFFIYCCHFFVLNVLQKIVVKMFSPDWIVLNLTFVITPVITILSLIMVAQLLSRYRFYKILTGGR